MDNLNQVFGEYDSTATIASNGKDDVQHYMAYVLAENGKIKLFREVFDMMPIVGDMMGIAAS